MANERDEYTFNRQAGDQRREIGPRPANVRLRQVPIADGGPALGPSRDRRCAHSRSSGVSGSRSGCPGPVFIRAISTAICPLRTAGGI